MRSDIDAKERTRLLKACQNLLIVRFQYARMVLIFCDQGIGRKDIAASADRLQAMIDDVIKVAVNYLNTGEGADCVQKMLEESYAHAQELFVMMQQPGREFDAPSGIHPDDWAWIEKVRSEKKRM